LAHKAFLKVLLTCALLSPLTALAQYTTSGLIYPDGVEPGDPSVCEAPAGKTCYWVDCDAVSDGTGTYASPFWGFETVFGYYNAGASYIQGSAVGGDIVYVKGTCGVTGSEDDATGPYKQIRIGRAAQMGTSSAPTIIKSYKGTAQAVFDGEYDATLATPVHSTNAPDTLIRVEQTATGNSYLKIQNIKFYRYHTNGLDVKYNTEGVTVQSVTCEEGRVDPTGTSGCLARQYNTAIVYADDFSYNYFLNNDNNCNTYVGDADSTCTVGTNDGTISLTSETSASNGSTVNIYRNRDVNSTKFIHQKHNGNVTVNIYENYSSDTDTFIHLRAKQTNIYNNVITGTTTYVLEPDPENETLNVSFNFYNNSVYMTAGQFMYDIETWNDDGTIAIYNNAIKSTSTTTPFMSLANFSGEYFVRGSFTMDHNYFDVPSAVQTSFSCFGPTSAGAGCTTRNFADTKTELGDTSSSVTDPSFTNAASGNLMLTPTSSARTAGRSSAVIGAITHAIPDFCGDTVRGKASVACTGTDDQDNDGYVDSEDCDDTNMWIYPGKWTGSGCTGGQIRKCDTDGNYDACQALNCSDFSTSGTCKFVDCVNGSNSNAGTAAAPWQSLQMVGADSGSTPAGWYDLAPGDTVLIAGYCDDYYDTTTSSGYYAMVYLTNSQSGSAGNPVTFMQWPGRAKWQMSAPFVYAGIQGQPFELNNADYVTISGVDMGNMRLRHLGSTSSGSDTAGEGTGDGIFIDAGSDHVTIEDSYLHDLWCWKSGNCSAIENTAGSDNITIRRNVIWDIYDDQASNTAACNAISGNKATGFYQSADLTFTNNVVGYSAFRDDHVDLRRGIPFNYKHGLRTGTAGAITVENNTFVNGCARHVESGTANLSLRYNRMIQSQYAAIGLFDMGGPTYLQDIEVAYNTIRNAKFLFMQFTDRYNTDTSSAATDCDGNESVGPISVHHNIADDWNTSYNQDNSFLMTYPYTPDDLYTKFISSGQLTIDNNCYQTDAANLRFGLHEANNGCATACCQYGLLGSGYTTFTSWQGTGFDTNSVQVDPALDSNDLPTTVNSTCVAAGWNTGGGASPTPTPTPSPSPTPTPSATPTPPPGGGAGAGTAGTGTRFRKGQL
jgi:hypothetical protein